MESRGHQRVIVIGHRGARGEVPENTLEGFLHAYEHGIRHFELDVQISQDGHLVVHHDLTLRRTTGHKGRTHHHDATVLAGLDARFNTPPWPDRIGVPKLESVLEALPEVESFQLEVKDTGSRQLQQISKALTRLLAGRERERCAVTSGAFDWITTFKHEHPHIRTGVVVEYAWQRPLDKLRRTGADIFVLSKSLVTQQRVVRAHELGREVSVWTVNDVHTALRMAQLGVDSLITDYPSHMLKVVTGQSAARCAP
ncbi:MAG: glycerophosphodiester phosphodiesterase [Gammaproteobacteria bacterium]|nr:MAG: glycerophosphodiester phosphodiesterase [Gammaproteobacteria bacterium]